MTVLVLPCHVWPHPLRLLPYALCLAPAGCQLLLQLLYGHLQRVRVCVLSPWGNLQVRTAAAGTGAVPTVGG